MSSVQCGPKSSSSTTTNANFPQQPPVMSIRGLGGMRASLLDPRPSGGLSQAAGWGACRRRLLLHAGGALDTAWPGPARPLCCWEWWVTKMGWPLAAKVLGVAGVPVQQRPVTPGRLCWLGAMAFGQGGGRPHLWHSGCRRCPPHSSAPAPFLPVQAESGAGAGAEAGARLGSGAQAAFAPDACGNAGEGGSGP